jgi:hypothetical protein
LLSRRRNGNIHDVTVCGWDYTARPSGWTELESVWQKLRVLYFDILFQNSREGSEQKHGQPRSAMEALAAATSTVTA